MTHPPLKIRDRSVGTGSLTYVVAEAGVNHNGDAKFAHDLVELAANAGADAVKFQTFDAQQLVSSTAGTADYQRQATGEKRQRSMLESLMLPADSWHALRDHADSLGLHFLSTPFDLSSATLLVDLGVPALKVASGELTNTPFIEALTEFRLPLLISTGMANTSEVEAALRAAAAAPSVALLHCVSQYPAPTEEANLRAIPTMRQQFDVEVGWSDHTQGALTAIMATSLGASIIEKHITTDTSLPGPDHAASSDGPGFVEYVRVIRQAEVALGNGEKRPQPSEYSTRMVARRSWHAARPLRAGEILAEGDVVALRPATGLPPSTAVIGRRLAGDIPAGQVLEESCLET